MEHYYSLNEYCKQNYGEKVYRISLGAATNCPNRDGTCGTGGCAFCSAGGSGDFAEQGCTDENFSEQFEKAKGRISAKTKAEKFIAYFQSFTGTHATSEAELDHLFRVYEMAAIRPDVAAVSIGTRPDCLGPGVLEKLKKLVAIKPVFVELGLQTSNEKTAVEINRCYDNSVYEKAVKELHALGINVITHIIIGLPGESYDDWLQSVRFAAEAKTDGLKLQLLHVLRGTALEERYNAGEFSTLSMDEYIDAICRLLAFVPEDVVIHRLTGDGPKSILISPTWSGDKKRVLNTLNAELNRRNVKQGSAL
ncbi:MAG: TIGR01212 family radical SAM protein [Clostridia bacterium]|nr:TIGR01212 family radical SAM protein [Clostridia bacterium]